MGRHMLILEVDRQAPIPTGMSINVHNGQNKHIASLS